MAASVSVIMAAWNAADFIEPAIRSALDQEGVEVEVIVIDDASCDATGDVVRAIGDRRVIYERQAVNTGPAGARNRGLALARHDWICVLDSDDALRPGRLLRLARAGETCAADLVSDNFLIVGPKGEARPFLEEEADGSTVEIDAACFLQQNLLFRTPRPLGYLKPLMRRSFVQGHGLAYDPALRIGEDFQLVLEALLAGARYVRVRWPGYLYTAREGSISARLGAAETWAMVEAAERVRREAAIDPGSPLGRAFDDLTGSLRTGAVFNASIEALKAKRFATALALLAGRPRAVACYAMPIRARLGRLLPQLGERGFRNGA